MIESDSNHQLMSERSFVRLTPSIAHHVFVCRNSNKMIYDSYGRAQRFPDCNQWQIDLNWLATTEICCLKSSELCLYAREWGCRRKVLEVCSIAVIFVIASMSSCPQALRVMAKIMRECWYANGGARSLRCAWRSRYPSWVSKRASRYRATTHHLYTAYPLPPLI